MFGLRVVETALWGGLFLTLVIAGVGIVASLPLGILFALGRRSDMPIVRAVCITFIEVMRGVPLITILFMASVMLPLFLPRGSILTSFSERWSVLLCFRLHIWPKWCVAACRRFLEGQYEAPRRSA